MELIVQKEDEHTKRMRRMGYRIIVDPVVFKFVEAKRALAPGAMVVGKYHFLDSIIVDYHIGKGTPYLRARAAAIVEIDQITYGVIDHFNVSNLVSGLSNLLHADVNHRGFTLYQDFAGKDDISRKRAFVEKRIINTVLEVFKESQANCVDWKFIEKDEYLASLNNIESSLNFKTYIENREYDSIN